MEQCKTEELDTWRNVLEYMGDERITLGPYFSFQLRRTPRHILFMLSRYKFAAKLLGIGKRVLEVGCSEGVGTVLLAEFAQKVVALDIEPDSIVEAEKTFGRGNIEFINCDFIEAEIDRFDGVVSMDVIEHIYPDKEALFFSAICRNLNQHGICILGTPNETSDQYASEHTKMGHVNLFTSERLRDTMDKYFHNVFIFSANDEIVHTGFYPMANYLIAVGVGKREM